MRRRIVPLVKTATILRWVLCLSVTLGLVCSAAAQPTDELPALLEGYRAQRYKDVFPGLARLSTAGNVTAQAVVCESYLLGRGVERTLKPVSTCYSAMQAGNPLAMGVVAQDMVFAKSNRTDVAKGLELAEQGSRLGDARSLYVLGEAYYFGVGKTQDTATALTHLEKASSLGHAGASTFLGQVLYTGSRGAPQNQARGRALLDAGSQAGNAEAFRVIGDIYMTGNGVPRNVAIAARNYNDAASLGSAQGAFQLYGLYTAGNSEKLQIQARKALEFSAESNYGPAMYALGVAAWNEARTERERERAEQWFRGAYAEGVPEAGPALAFALTEGRDRPQYGSAAGLLNLVMRQYPRTDVHDDAAIMLASFIGNGWVRSESGAAERLLEQASRSENPKIADRARAVWQDMSTPRTASGADTGNQNAIGALVLGGLLLGILAANNAPQPGDASVLDGINRGLQCNMAANACRAQCTSDPGAMASVCRQSCSSSC